MDVSRRTVAALIVSALVLYFTLTALTVRTLRPWVDEAWASAPVWSLLNRGFTGTPSFDASAFGDHGLPGLDRICYWEPPLYLGIQAIWFTIFPFSLEWMRILSVISGLAGLLCWYVIMERLTRSAGIAALVCLFMSCDYLADTAASLGRADALAFAFQSGAYAVFLTLREKRFNLAVVLSQSFVVASGLAHPNGGVLAFLGLAFLTIYFDRRRIRFLHILIAAVPYVVGGVAWGAFILKDPASFVAQYNYQASMRFFRASHPFSAIWHEGQRYLAAMGLAQSAGIHSLKALIFVAYGVSIVAVLSIRELRQSTAARVLLALAGIYLFYFTFLEATKAYYYFIYIVYVYTAILALFLSWCWNKRPRLRPAMVLVTLGLIMVQSGGLIMRARANDYNNGYMAAVRYLRDHSNAGDLIVGSHELGFALGFQNNFLDDYRLGTASGKRPDYIVVEEIYQDRFEMLRRQRPEDYLKVRALLSEYHEVYNHNNYRIFGKQAALGQRAIL